MALTLSVLICRIKAHEFSYNNLVRSPSLSRHGAPTEREVSRPATTTHYGLSLLRYGISDRTVDRWTEADELPKPVYIRGRRYWSEESLDERDKARLTTAQPDEEAA